MNIHFIILDGMYFNCLCEVLCLAYCYQNISIYHQPDKNVLLCKGKVIPACPSNFTYHLSLKKVDPKPNLECLFRSLSDEDVIELFGGTRILT